MIRLKLLLYKFLDASWTAIGCVFAYAKRSFSLDLADLDEIVINRADRLGDAVISLPFLICFVEKLRLGDWKGKVTVIASSYNRELLLPLLSLENVDLVTVETDAMRLYDRSMLRTFGVFANALERSFGRVFSKVRSRIAFVDLIDSVSEMSIGNFPQYSDAYWLSSNRGPFSVFFDCVSTRRFAGSSGTQLVESYIDAFSQFFRLGDFAGYVNSRSGIFYPDPVEKPGKSILVFV